LEYETKLAAAGFDDAELHVLRTHQTAELLGACLPAWCREFSRDELDAVMCRFTSSLVRARKPTQPSNRNDRHG
jgi:hypothetical protein